jgi:hypothetical protein
MKATDLKIGTTLKKGNRIRTIKGFETPDGALSLHVCYSVPSDSTNDRVECIATFEEWMKKAVII